MFNGKIDTLNFNQIKRIHDSMAESQIPEEYNLQEAWDRACTSFAQTTNVDLTAKPKFSIDEVLNQIRAKQDEDNEKNNKYRAVKDVLGKTLNFVTVLGGIAAQGASMVSILYLHPGTTFLRF